MDIKFCNVVVEVLISNCVTIFNSPSPMNIGLPCPPKPAHNLLASSNGSEATITSGDSTPISATKPKENERNIDEAISAAGASITRPKVVQAVQQASTTPSSPIADSTSSNSTTTLVRQKQPPPPPKNNNSQFSEKTSYESKSSDDLTNQGNGSPSGIYPNLSASKYTAPRIIDGGIASARPASSSDDKLSPISSGSASTLTGPSTTRSNFCVLIHFDKNNFQTNFPPLMHPRIILKPATSKCFFE